MKIISLQQDFQILPKISSQFVFTNL